MSIFLLYSHLYLIAKAGGGRGEEVCYTWNDSSWKELWKVWSKAIYHLHQKKSRCFALSKTSKYTFFLFSRHHLFFEASPTQWTRVWANSGSWWWTGKPGMLQSMGSQRVGHDWVTELNWTCFFSVEFVWNTVSTFSLVVRARWWVTVIEIWSLSLRYNYF